MKVKSYWGGQKVQKSQTQSFCEALKPWEELKLSRTTTDIQQCKSDWFSHSIRDH